MTINSATGGKVWSPHLVSIKPPAPKKDIFTNILFLGGVAIWVTDVVFFVIFMCHYAFQAHITIDKNAQLFSSITHSGNFPFWPALTTGLLAVLSLALFFGSISADANKNFGNGVFAAIHTSMIAGFAFFVTALILFSEGNAINPTDEAKTWIKEQAGTHTNIPDSFALDQTYSYNLYGDNKSEWKASVKINGDKTTVILEPITK